MGALRIVQLCLWAALFCDIGWANMIGTEFITTFMEEGTPNLSSPKKDLRISATEDNTTIIVTVNGGGSYNKSITLGSKTTISMTLPESVENRGNVFFKNSVSVFSNKPITVLALNHRFKCAETSVVYPDTALGTEYYLITPKTGASGSSKVFSIIAMSKEANIKLHTKGSIQVNGQRYASNSDVTITLPPYQGMQVLSADDLSGSHIVSTTIVAVFSGHTCAKKLTNCNHAYEQLLPVSHWGKSYLVAPLTFQNDVDLVYVIAAGKTEVNYFFNTTHKKEDMVAGQVLEIGMSTTIPLRIESGDGVQVTYFNVGGRSKRFAYSPFLMNIMPIESYCSAYYIYGQRDIDNYATIIAETTSTADIRFDGRPLYRPQWTEIAGTRYSWYEFNFGNRLTSHKFEHPSKKIGVQIEGIGSSFSCGSPGTCVKDPGPPPPSCRTTVCPSRQVCVMKNGITACTKPEVDLCWAAGDPHLFTLDKVYYDFMGTCTYTFATVSGDVGDLPKFTIQMKQENRGNVRVSYVGEVYMLTGPHRIVIRKGEYGHIRVDNAVTQLPVSLMNGTLKIFQSGNSAVLQLGNDVQVLYDWNHVLMLEITRRYAGKMSGMCGNYNQDPKDDFQTPTGALVKNAVDFGASWAMEDNTICWHDCRGPCLSCPPDTANKYLSDDYCGLINKANGPFSECHAIVDPKMFHENCVFDVCVNGGYKKISCDAVQSYAETCQRAGAPIKDWRNASGCPMQCRKDSSYQLCGRACPATCEDPEGKSVCVESCIEMCQCNSGFVLSEGKCIPKGSCGCSYNGFTYSPNQSFWNDTKCQQRCVCSEKTGKVECVNKPCGAQEECAVRNGIQNCYPLSYGVCTAYGDPHLIAFDGTKYDFHGTCVYQLASLCDKSRGLTDFEVWVQNKHRGNLKVSYASVVTIKIFGLEFTASTQYPNKIMVNNILINLPFRSNDGQFSFYRNPCSAVFSFGSVMKVIFDYNSIVRVIVPSTYANAVCGLCGNFNGVPNDDLTPKGGVKPTDPTTFGKSWKVKEVPKCKDEGSAVCAKLSTEEKRQKDGASECGVLMSSKGPFRDCHARVNPEPFFKDCVYDYCILQKRQAVFCSAISAYVMACQEAGATVYPWRSQNFCPFSCPAHSSYEVCADPCPATCNGLSVPEGCDGKCTEGCVCNNGFILSGGQCVPIADCGCNYNDVYYSVGESMYDDNKCSQKCSCSEGGIMTCAPSHCSSNEECQVQNGVLGCFPRGSATCTASGFSHYRTFDNHHYDFGGLCSYVLAKSCEEKTSGRNLTKFQVTVTHEKKGSGPGAIRSITVEVHQVTLTVNHGKRGVIQVNGVTSRLPVTLQSGNIRAECYGQGVSITTNFGFSLRYNYQSLASVTVPSNYMDTVCGLCGNYNGVAKDDAGTTPAEINAFGNKWRHGDTEESCDGCGSADNPCPSCKEEKKKIFLKKINCGIISDPSGPFAKCHAKVDPEPFVNDCVSDLCQTNGEDSSVLCDSVAVYADICKYEGVTDIAWRTDDFCPMKCGPHSHYTTCADMCSTTCASIYDTYECSVLCDEGCECDEDYVFDGENCVPLDQCGCFYNGCYYQANEITLSEDCSLECTCNPISGMSCRNTSCAAGDKCQTVNGVRSCVNSDPCKSTTCRRQESCHVQDGLARCRPDYTGVCYAWGDPHTVTFDGYSYDFQGTCSYVLSKYDGGDPTLEPFQVTIKNENRGDPAVSYIKMVVATIYNITIAISNGEFPQIRVNNEMTNLPVILADGKMNVTQSGLTAIVTTESGIEVIYDWNWVCAITLPSSYHNDVSGLCGNFNQDLNDDRKSSNGTLVTSIVEWAVSWKVHDPDPFCFDECPGNCPTCDDAKKKKYSNDDNCGLISKENGPFQACVSKVNPKEFFNGCLLDVCMSDGAKNILCQSLETYASACQSEGVKLLDWRTPSNCPKSCEDTNSHYNACGNACPASCFDRDAPMKCTKPCIEICECNKGMVLSSGKCVPISSCGCQYNGRYYEPDQSWYNEKCSIHCKCDSVLGIVVCEETKCKDSETCKMSNGIRGCYPKKYSTCKASGNYYTTFDNKKIDFKGTCIYQLVKVISKDPSLTDFSVTVKNDRLGNGVSSTKDITLKIHNVTLTMSKDYPQQIKVNEHIVNLPFYSEFPKLTAYSSGASTVVQTGFDLTLIYDSSSCARAILPSTYKAAVNGLCGNNNGDPSDDLNIKDGVTAANEDEFGSHWKVGEVEGCEGTCSKCAKCNEADKQRYKSDQYCGLLSKSNGPFSQCHASIDPMPYLDDCVSEVCASKGHLSVVCTRMASYASDCQRNGSQIKEWRTPSFCELTCPMNSHHKLLGDGCPVTCFGLTSPRSCVKSFTEGCYCNDGFVRSGDECVPISQCGCVFQNTYYKFGQEFFPGNQCQKKCTCGKDGITTCRDHSCGVNEECKVVDGFLGCHAKEIGQCIVWGNRHYITFDKVYYDMQGTCRYTLFKIKTDKIDYSVTVENEPYGHVAATKSVMVTIGGYTIYLERGKTWTVELNNERYNLPCRTRKYPFWISEEGNNVIVYSKYGITLLYDRQSFVSIWAPSSYAGLTQGLCGNFNKNTNDEFRLPNGTVVTDLAVFAKSWAMDGTRTDCHGCTGDHCFTCDQVATAEAKAPTKCGLITDPQGPFKDCHTLVPPENFAKSCVFDVCASAEGKDALCASLQTYASMCQDKNAKIGTWRNIAGCPLVCPANSHYEPCTHTCKFTCNSLLDSSTCGKKCREGCQCNDGYMFDGKNCVPLSACGCNLDGRYLSTNESVITDDCSRKYTCNPGGRMTWQSMRCAADEKCDVLDGVRTCVKKDPCKRTPCRSMETCQVQDEKAACVPDFYGQCWGWGDPHYQNLDGMDFDFQGTCSYVFAQYNGGDPSLEKFQIITKNDNRGTEDGSFIRRMELNMYGLKISNEVGEFPQMRVNNELINLPASLAEGKIRMHRSGLTAVVETLANVTVTFDWNSLVTLSIPSSYYNSVSGLCGNFNQNPNDDQKSPNGKLTNSTVDWAASWTVYDRDPFCFHSCPGQCPTCEESKKKLYGGDENCGILFKKDGPFRECSSKVSPNKFFDGCLYDVCINDGAKVMLCQALESYARTCMSQGIKIYDWRTPSGCPKTCEDPNSHYNACGNACPASCADKDAPVKCTKSCVEICECNENMVLSGDKCVPPTSCGCQYNGRYYEPLQNWYNEKCNVQCKCDPKLAQVVCQSTRCKDSETCQIVNGIRGCYPTEYSTCTVYGGPHYTTFDGMHVDFTGTCTYELVNVTSNDPSITHFSILVQKDHHGTKDLSFTKEVILKAYNKMITISKDHPHQIKVDGCFVNLPYYFESTKLIVFTSGAHTVVKTDFGLTLSCNDWSHVTVELPNTYKGAVGGLCGDNNGDAEDDVILPGGVKAKTPEEFGKYWKVEDVEECEDVCPECSKCSENDKNVYKSDQYCGLLTKPDGPFSQCYNIIDPMPFFNNCLYDVCAYKGRQSYVCASIASYVSECQRNGSLVKEWRTPSFCELVCPLNSHYKLLGDGCPVTCFDLRSPRTCVKSSTEGCYCNNGFVLSGDDCVPISECGCVFENMYYKLGEEFFKDNRCQKKCTCGKNGITTCQDHTCGTNDECKVVDGILGCHAKEFGQCIVWGDPHYKTFDYLYYVMQGTCSYILVKVKYHQITFIVEVENEPYGDVAVTKSVKVTIGIYSVHLERGRPWSIKVNGERYNIPCKSQKQEFWIYQEGNNIIIRTKHEFTVLLDQYYFVSVWVPSSYAGLTEGLCGNYNKNPRDDLRLQNGTIVTDVSLLAESWTVGRGGSTCKGCVGSQCPTCSKDATTEAKSSTKCGMISDPQGPFRNCHSLVPPERYTDSCVYDICAGRGGQDALCASLQAYTALCQEKGAKVLPWRDVTGCPFSCPDNSKYSLCTRTCSSTCYGLLTSMPCTKKCSEGCQCDHGYVFDGNSCITMDHCGCLHEGRYLKANESVLNENCSQECTCDHNLGLTCHKRTCAKDEKCQLLDGVRSCVSTDPCKFKTCRSMETCRVQDDKAVCEPDYNGVCRVWGDPHFYMLDGKDFSFEGTCSYTLVKYTGNDPTLEPFHITIKNDNRGSQAASFVRKMAFTMYDTTISVEVQEFPKVRVNGELANLPLKLLDGKMNIYRSGLTAVIETASHVNASYDWNWYVQSSIPSSYYHKVSGLCGNFNQDPNDDQKSPNGTLMSSIVDWAASWSVYDKDPFCFHECKGECPTCEESKKKLYGGEDYCGILFKKDGPFRECISKISPNKFFDACLVDLCKNNGAKYILCKTIETYASTCQSQGLKIYDWRTPLSCPKVCEDKNSHYNACGNACPASCADRQAPEKCTKHCVETCECNANMVFSGNACIAISSCGCQYNGRYYEPKETWSNENCSKICKCDPILGIMNCQETSCKDSEACMLVNGRRGCYPTEHSTCTASGCSHYKTFDGKQYPFMGACSYRLVNVISNDSTHFTIDVEKDHRGNSGVSYTKTVTLKIYNKTVTMSKEHPKQIKIDGRLTELPFYHYEDSTAQIMAYYTGAAVVVKTDCDLTVMYDGRNYLRVDVPGTYRGSVEGLCGNNNRDPSDDFTTSDGRIAKSPEEFGEHWKVGGKKGCADCPDCPKCSEADKEVYKSDKYCGLLIKSDGPFSQCHGAINPAPFFEHCLFEACAYKGHQTFVCDSISTYVSECQRNGTMIKWRTPSFCEWTCPSNSHYEQFGNGCPSTCDKLGPPLSCEKSITEGCYCNNGFFLSGQDCVPAEECGCVVDNTYYQLGEEFYKDDVCLTKCTCGNNGITTCQRPRKHICGAYEECKVVDGKRGCYAIEFGQCKAWGNHHYVTFDNMYYDMQGTCSYILVKVTIGGVPIMVTMQNEPYGTVAATKSVTMTIGNHTIKLEKGRTWSAEVNRERVNTPCKSQKREYWINQEGNNVIIQTIHGFKMLYDQQYFVSVWVPSSYSGKTEGLCGNYNKNPSDDLRLQNGTVVNDSDISLFAESWTVARDGSSCKGCSGSQCPTCSEAAITDAKSLTKCGMIADPQGPFKDCHALVPPETHTNSCVFDTCAGRGGHGASLQAYTALCQEKGAKVVPWRNNANYPLSCPANSRYEQCTQSCGFTCYSLLAPSTCSNGCYEGCECNSGYMFDGENCVPMNKCGCTFNERYVKDGEWVVTENCGQRCKCQSGVLSCVKLGCSKNEICQVREGVRGCQPQESRCILRTNNNFVTFDGVSGPYPTDGPYVVSSSCSEDVENHFIVVVQMKACSRSKIGRSLQIFTPQGLVSVNEEQNIWLNGWELQASRDLGNGSVKIQISKSEITVELHKQITVVFYKTGEIQIIAKGQVSGKTCGSCGNFNGDATDDLLLKTGEVSSDISFTIRSWVAKHLSSCPA
ncbi:IgGFc-binding protein-like [Leptodactylus fuscus]|uniref:IgGFc-binding protein-like n=1 Tax=Leptodactylus fuscus TaxID=238119 RepID=UPI003F4EBE1A